jgi:hypothetical protein
MTHDKHPSRWPTVTIIVVGVVATVLAVIWAASSYDAEGHPILSDAGAGVLAAIIGAGATLGATALQRTVAQIKHQVKNTHSENLRDDLDTKHDELIAAITEVKHTQHQHAQSLARLESVPAEVGGIRRDLAGLHEDVGRLATADQQMRSRLETHIDWSQEQASRIDGIEDRKKES